jgi:hypothetical protein
MTGGPTVNSEIELPTVALWRCTPELVVALDTHLGEPTDTYVNGAQVWLRDDGPRDITLEWRLHPVGGYQRPASTSTTNVFRRVVTAIVDSVDNPPGDPVALWGGLEVFSAYDDALRADELRGCCVALLGIEPDAVGSVNHEPIGDAWEQTSGQFDIFIGLFDALIPSA